MPLSEFHRMAGGRLEFSQQKSTSYSTDLTHFPDDEFVELVWENGQVMMQGQSSRARRNMNSNNFEAQIPKFRDKDLGNATNSRMGKFGVMGSLLDDFTATVPSSDLGLDQDDEMAPWLNYDDPLQKSYCPDFLPELSTVTINELPASNVFSSIDKKNSINQTTGKANGVNSEHLSFERSHIPAPSLRPGLSSVVSNNVNHGDPTYAHASSSGFSNSNSAIINFAHFSRPVSHVRADIRNANTAGTPSSSAMGKMGCENEGTLATINNPFESRLDLINDVRKEKDTNSQPYLLPKLVNSRTTEKVETVYQENVVKIGEPPNQVDGTAPAHGMPGGEKVVEPVVASSSVCSGNNAEQASNDPMHDLKRKSHETDSEDRSEDVEEESVGIRKGGPARGGPGAKRSRAAEVHNLSERRRRDRINEKMRALQELIPNCNKVDKASMLDEAIEYLKTLQLQVQIMSMGAGLYMPPMMLPPGFQHVPAHMPHFLPMMGVGMGMGMGMGLGMGMQGAHFHGPRAVPFSGPANFQMMAGPNLQVFGHGGPALNMSALRGPSVPLSGGPPMKFAGEGVNAFGMAARLDIPCSGPLSDFKDLMQQNTNSQVMHNVEACSSMNQVSGQCQVTHDGFEHSSLVCKNDGSTRSR